MTNILQNFDNCYWLMCVRFFWRSMSESLFSHFLWLMVLSCRRGPWGLNAFYDSSLIQEQFSLTILFLTIKQQFFVHIFYDHCQHQRTTRRHFTTWQHMCWMCIVCVSSTRYTEHTDHKQCTDHKIKPTTKDLWSFV